MCSGALPFYLSSVCSRRARRTSASWLFGGNDITNSRTQAAETKISSSTVGQLAVKWTAPTHGDVSATPTVANGVVYFPDWGGYINAVNAQTGAVIWSKQLYADYGDPAPAGYPTSINMISRTSPAVYGNEVIFGDNNGGGNSAPGGARVFAVNAQTGDLLWKTTVDTNPVAVVTANPVVADGKLIIGVSSNEEGIAAGIWGPYACCTFRGKVLVTRPHDRRHQLGDVHGSLEQPRRSRLERPLHGVGPRPTLPMRVRPAAATRAAQSGTRRQSTSAPGVVFIGTGNNYTATDTAVACQQAATPRQADCAAPDDWFDAVLSLNLDTGAIAWGNRVEGWDAWTVACAFGLPPGVTWCPSPQSPDFDFGGSGPNLMPGKGPKGTTLVGVGQKSGIYWAFDAKTGATVWDTLVGPGAALGGIEWGTAFDGGRIYVPLANSDNKQYNLHIDGPSATGGSYAALDPSTGKFDWQVPTPGDGYCVGNRPRERGERRRLRRRLGRWRKQQHVRALCWEREGPLELPRERLDLVRSRHRQRRRVLGLGVRPLRLSQHREQVLRLQHQREVAEARLHGGMGVDHPSRRRDRSIARPARSLLQAARDSWHNPQRSFCGLLRLWKGALVSVPRVWQAIEGKKEPRPGVGVAPGGAVAPISTTRGKPQSRRNALRAVQHAGDEVGLNGEGRQTVGLHDLRHSFVAIALANGVTLPEAAMLARHANPRVTLAVYAGLTDGAREVAVDKLLSAGFGA